MKPIEELTNAHLRGLQPYIPGSQPTGTGWIKLNTNEFPFSPPSTVTEAIMGEMTKLARYPNPTSQPLREAIAAHHGLSSSRVIIGNGSDDILNLLVRAFGGRGRITVETFPSYSLYPVLTAIAGAAIQSIPFQKDFSLPVEALAASDADLIFLTCPNAPTGIRFPLDQLEQLAERFMGLLVIDEAYAEFAEENALSLLQMSDRIVVTRTFSKAYGLAGLRVGYGLASTEVVSVLDRVRDSYNVNRLSQAGALAALQSPEFYQPAIEQIKSTRDRTRQVLEHLGWHVYPSEANFLFGAPVDRSGTTGAHLAASLFKYLEERKILVRYFPRHPLTERHLRISIGSPSEMDRFIEEVGKWHDNG